MEELDYLLSCAQEIARLSRQIGPDTRICIYPPRLRVSRPSYGISLRSNASPGGDYLTDRSPRYPLMEIFAPISKRETERALRAAFRLRRTDNGRTHCDS